MRLLNASGCLDALTAPEVARALDGMAWQDCDFRVLIENTAGAEFSLGSNFEQVGELVEHLRRFAPVGACLDTCHCHVAGYDIVSSGGYEETVGQIEQLIGLDTVRVWHMNDARGAPAHTSCVAFGIDRARRDSSCSAFRVLRYQSNR